MREVVLCIEQWRDEQELLNMRAGLIAAQIVNTRMGRKASDRAWGWRDFFGADRTEYVEPAEVTLQKALSFAERCNK